MIKKLKKKKKHQETPNDTKVLIFEDYYPIKTKLAALRAQGKRVKRSDLSI